MFGSMKAIALLIALFPLAVAAQDVCPAVADHEADKDALLQRLSTSRDQNAAQLVSGDLWRIWTDAPDARAQAMLDDGMARLRGDYAGARDVLDDLVAYCPDYAEGWNQRAFAYFLMQDYAAALTDLDRALDLDPRHVAALSGRALTLMGLERDAEGQVTLREALRLNPWLAERSLLTLPPEETL